MWLRELIDYVDFERYLRRIAHMTIADGGATACVPTRQFPTPLDVWHFPKYPARTAILPPQSQLVHALRAFVSANERYLCEPDTWLGTWIHPMTRYCHLDITTHRVDLDEAFWIAREVGRHERRPIVALYNAKRRQTIYLEPPSIPT
jgi:hypothetical protein